MYFGHSLSHSPIATLSTLFTLNLLTLRISPPHTHTSLIPVCVAQLIQAVVPDPE